MAGAPCPGEACKVREQEMREQFDNHTWTNDIESVQSSFADDTVQVGVNKSQTRTRSPMAEQTGFNIIGGDITLDEDIVLQEDHG
jgi:hypothetical protein